MSGYIFWCSNCKVSHAGECQPVASTWYPAEGSLWHHEVLLQREGWKRTNRIYAVLNFDAAESRTVTVRPVKKFGTEKTYHCPRSAWDGDGFQGKSYKYR